MNLFWDSCVFIRYLTETPPDCVADIAQFIGEARDGKLRIWTSSIVFTEVRPSFLNKRFGGRVEQFFSDFQGAFRLIDPNPSILADAGRLRDAKSTNPGDPKKAGRSIGTGDSIHLMTAVTIRDHFDASDLVFHTFDDGKTRNWEGKSIPLLSFEKWYPITDRVPLIEKICGLERCKPVHPTPDFATKAGHTNGLSQPSPSAK